MRWLALCGAAGLSVLAGCGPSESEATSNAYLASFNGITIDHLVSRNLRPDDAERQMMLTPAVEAILAQLRADHDATRARAALEAVVADHPQDASAYAYLARLQMDAKEPEAAVESYRHALEQRTDLPDLWLDLATALLACNKPTEAYQAAHTAAAADPSSPNTLRRAGRIFYQAQQFGPAEIAFSALTRLEPDDPENWHDRARNLAMAGNRTLSMTCFDTTVALYAKIEKPTAAQSRDYAEVLTDYGIIAQLDHADEKAKILFENATQIDKTYSMAWHKLSQQQSKPQLKPLLDLEAAVRSANLAVSLSEGKNAEYLHQLAKVYAMSGKLDRAVAAEQSACRLVKNKYDQKLALLKRLQADRSRAFDPDNF